MPDSLYMPVKRWRHEITPAWFSEISATHCVKIASTRANNVVRWTSKLCSPTVCIFLMQSALLEDYAYPSGGSNKYPGDLDHTHSSVPSFVLAMDPGYGRGVPFWAFYFSG